jgi:ribonuclease BN (tRNA processing enzyme)
MPELLVLGSGPGFPVAERGHSSILLQTGQHQLLIDAGEPCSRSLWAQGIDPAKLDAILITHGHSDHIGGLPMILQTAWIAHRKEPLPVYLPGELIQPLTAWLNATYIGPEFANYALELHSWEDSPSLTEFELEVVPCPTSHLRSLAKPPSADRFRAYSLRVEHRDFRLLFSGDLGSPHDLEPQLSNPPDLLICELAHFEPKELFRYLSARLIKRILLTHLAPELSTETDALKKDAERALRNAQILIAEDGLRIAL